MKKIINKLLISIIFIIAILSINTVDANDNIGIMKVYKLKINLKNIDTDKYTVELMDGIHNRIYESQEGNETGVHHFAIATDMDERHLVNYWVKIKFKNGETKEFPSIDTDKLVVLDEDTSESSFSYEYNIRVNLFPKEVINAFGIILVISLIGILIIYLKKRKRWIK